MGSSALDLPGTPCYHEDNWLGQWAGCGVRFQNSRLQGTEAMCTFAFVALQRPVSLRGDSASLGEELAVCILSPSVPNGDFQFSWLIQSLFPTATEVFIVLCHLDFGSHPETLWVSRHSHGATLCFWHLWTPAPP